MFNSSNWNYDGVQFIEFYGLRRSGNHAVLAWLMKNLDRNDSELQEVISPTPEIGFLVKRCGSVYHINDVGTGWATNNPAYIAGLIDGYVSSGAKTIILSYEDYEPQASLGLTFPSFFPFLKDALKIALVRDLPNVMASRHKKIEGIKAKGANPEEWGLLDMNVNKINAWIYCAIEEKSTKIRYEDWLTSKEYRDEFCKNLNIPNLDYTGHMSSAGGGSSFTGTEEVPNAEDLLNRWKSVDIPKEWKGYLDTPPVIRARRKAGYFPTKQDAEKIMVIGDSHTEVFEGYIGKDYIFEQVRCHGATARGAISPITKTDSLKIFRNGLATKEANRVIIELGEVDCGYLLWMKNKQTGEPLLDLMNESIDRLIKFVEEEVYQYFGPEDVIMMSVIPPIVEDMTDKRFLDGNRGGVNPSLAERRSLTRMWNKRLARECSARGWKNLNINPKITTGEEVIQQFRNPNPWDHHLWPASTIGTIIEELERL